MKRAIIILVLILIVPLLSVPVALAYDQEVANLTSQLATDVKSAGKTTIAVADFTDLRGDVTELGRFLAEEFSVAFAETGLQVIDRTHLRVILQENKLATTGLISPATAQKLGKITGVQALITGTLTPFGDSVRVAVKVLDAETARVVASVRGNIARTDAISDLLEAGLSVRAPESPKVVKRKAAMGQGQHKYTGAGYSFVLRKCVRTSGGATCHFTIVNEGEDRKLSLYGNYGGNNRTILFDELGNEYSAANATLGRGQETGYVEKMMISGIPIDASFTFDGIDPEASSISVLQVRYYADGSRGEFKFRNLPFSNS